MSIRASLFAIVFVVGCGGSDSDPAPDASPPGATLQMPPVTLASGQETTLCVTLQLDNSTPQMLRHIHSSIAAGSHHLIAYRVPATTPLQPTPMPCQPFSDITSGAQPMIIAESAEADVVYPDGVGLPIEVHQVVRLEQHYFNSGDAAIQSSGSVTLDLSDPGPSVVAANLMFWGAQQFSISPHEASSADYFHVVTPGTHVFALTTHEHHFGTLATIEQAAAPQPAAGQELYRNTDWAHPPLKPFSPAIVFDGTEGLRVHCEWFNASEHPVTFGLSASTDEMCFFWAYYYPSHGFELCNEMGCVAN
jgi:hypothetical protein